MSLYEELKRRNVFRVGIAYLLLGWAVLQGADFLLDLAGAPEWVIRALAVFGLVGLPLALFFAWAFELTPEGVRRESEVDRSRSVTPQTGKKLNRVIIALLLLIIVLMAVERLFYATGIEPGGPQAKVESQKSIAVLPFTDLSEAQDQGWFADGLAEEILNALVKAPDLQVAARTSSFTFKGSNKEIPEIAVELGVAHVLEGSVRRAGDRIRVTAQLIRASDGFHLWSQNYDREVSDMIGIQEDLARSIATALETGMDPEALAQMAKVGTDSVEAYQEYLRGVQLAGESMADAAEGVALNRRAYERFERARGVDPGFAEAHGQAAVYWKTELQLKLRTSGSSGLEPRQILENFNERIDLAIDNAKLEADRVRYLAERAQVDVRLTEARRLFRQYLDLRPGDEEARRTLGSVLMALSDTTGMRELLEYWKKAGQTDLNIATQLVNDAHRAGEAAPGADYGLDALERWPNATTLLYQTHRALLWAGRREEASRVAARFEALVPGGSSVMRAREACAAGNRVAAEAIRDEYLSRDDRRIGERWLLSSLLGDTDAIMGVLRPLEASGVPFQLASFLTYRQFDPRPFPALMAILEREGIHRPPPAVEPFRCPPPSQPSIAVLPFVNMSADPDNEYFSEGVAEEILNVLARIPELKVSARTSSFSYKGSSATVAQIAKDLGVNHVLEGSVRKAGDQVRVTAQLIEAGNDFHLWSETYDRKLDNIFAIQDEIAQSIAEALKVQLLPAADQPNQTGTTNLEAYELYLKGVLEWHLRTGESLERALGLFEQAVRLDPAFARAHAYRALTWAVLPDYSDRPLAEARRETRNAAETALKLDPLSVEAATALINPLLADSYQAIDALVEQGRNLIASIPGFATTHQWHGTNLLSAYRAGEAIAEYRTALELDPRSLVIHQNLAVALITLGRFEEAETLLQDLEALAPDYWDGALTQFLLFLVSDQREQAEQAGERLVRILGRSRNTVPVYLDLFFSPERKSAAAAAIAAFPRTGWWDSDNPSLIDGYILPLLFAAAGEYTAALNVLRSIAKRGLDFYPPALVRASRVTGEFNCRPDVQGFYAELDLPPLPKPPNCQNEDN